MERQEHGALVQAQRESFRSRATRDVAVRETDLKSSGAAFKKYEPDMYRAVRADLAPARGLVEVSSVLRQTREGKADRALPVRRARAA